jgi:NDP-mannose synthase
MKVVILAGGKGTRLRPFTTVFPKPLVPVGNMPIIEIIIRQLYAAGFRDVVITVGYLAELIESYLSRIAPQFPGLRISYVHETEPTGTAGSLSSISDVSGPLLVMNGDVLTNIDYRKLMDYHIKQGGALTISTRKKKVKIDLGILETENGILTNYIEKPEKFYDVSMGIYVYEPSVLSYVEKGKYLDFPDLVLRLIQDGQKVMSYECEDRWLDIGRHEDLIRAQEEFEKSKDDFLPQRLDKE